MFKNQMKFQKVLFLALLILQVVLFIYAIGLTTDFFPIYKCEAYGYLPGSMDFFNRIQEYDSVLVKSAIAMIVIGLLPFIFSSNTRRKYYVDNFVTQVLQVSALVACSIFLIYNSAKYKADFLETIDIEEYIKICAQKGWHFSGSTICLDLGFVVAGLLIIGAALIVFNYIWKYNLVNTENKILSGEIQVESPNANDSNTKEEAK